MVNDKSSTSRLPAIGRNPRGDEFAAYLYESISGDSADLFSRLDMVFRQKMSRYFEFKKLVCPERAYESLIVPIRTGGVVGQKSLPPRLGEIFPNKREKEIKEIAVDLSLLLADTVSDFNYIRYLQNAVTGILNSLLDPDTPRQIPELDTNVIMMLATKQRDILSYVINSASSLHIWIEKVLDFSEQVNDLHGVHDFVNTGDGEEYQAPNKKVLSARKNKKYVNTKTLSTYSTRTRMYFLYKSKLIFPGMIQGGEPVERIFMKYKPDNSNFNLDLSVLSNKQKRQKLEKDFSLSKQNQESIVDKKDLITVEFPFSGDRNLKVRHSQAGVFHELIKHTITNLKAQLKLDPNRVKRLVIIETSKGYLSVEVDNIKSSDIPKIESMLEELTT